MYHSKVETARLNRILNQKETKKRKKTEKELFEMKKKKKSAYKLNKK